MAVGISDQTDFGTDVQVIDDVSPVWALASGNVNLACALLRRLSTPSGSLDIIEDEPFESLDLRGYLNAKLDNARIANLRSRIAAVCRDDERVDSCSVNVVFTFATKTLKIELTIRTAQGPFAMVLAATAVTVEILSINGRQIQTTTSTTTTSSPQVIAIVGAKGEPGETGASGTSGTAQVTLDFGIDGDQGYKFATSGAEEVLFQRAVRFGDLPGSLTVAVIGEIASTLGTGTFKVRIGGSSLAVDGTVVLTMTSGSASFAAVTATGAFANPTGNLFVKITGQSSAGGEEAWARPPVVTIR